MAGSGLYMRSLQPSRMMIFDSESLSIKSMSKTRSSRPLNLLKFFRHLPIGLFFLKMEPFLLYIMCQHTLGASINILWVHLLRM